MTPISAIASDPFVSFPGSVFRDVPVTVVASGLQPDTDYDLTASDGFFGPANAPVGDARTDHNGSFRIAYELASSAPYSVSTVTLSVTSGSEDVAGQQVIVNRPVLNSDSSPVTCPGHSIVLSGYGFADGTYAPSGDYARFEGPAVARNGTLNVTAQLSDSLPADFGVSVIDNDSFGTTFDYSLARDAPRVQYAEVGATPWRLRYLATCFSPGERVTFQTLSASTRAPKTALVPASGDLTFDVGFVAGRAPRIEKGVLATGTRSHQTALGQGMQIWGTTLTAGADLGGNYQPSEKLLQSPRVGHLAAQSYCDLYEIDVNQDGSESPGTAVLRNETARDDCRLRILSNGNMALIRPNGSYRWAAGTQGTGAGNRLVMQQDGRLVLRNRDGAAVWDLEHGVLRSPRVLGETLSLQRGQSLVDGTARFSLSRTGDIVLSRSGRVLWQSHTASHGGTLLTLRRSGNLVLTGRHDRTVWRTHLATGDGYDKLVLTDTGNVRIIDTYGNHFWHRG